MENFYLKLLDSIKLITIFKHSEGFRMWTLLNISKVSVYLRLNPLKRLLYGNSIEEFIKETTVHSCLITQLILIYI